MAHMDLLKVIVGVVFRAFGAIATWFMGTLLIRLRWLAKIPRCFAFEHQLASDKKLREIAELLAAEFKGPAPGNVVCLGLARGTAARLLFHSGPNNRHGNIHRPDYHLQFINQPFRFLYSTVVYRRQFIFPMVLISEALM